MIQEDFLTYCEEKGYNAVHIKGRQRSKDIVLQRRDTAKHLYARGHSFYAIGKALEKDHTSIMHMVDDEFRERNNRDNLARYYEKRGQR